MARQAYTSDIEISFISGEETTEIASEFVKYILIENLYADRYMPVIYLSLAVTNEMYDNIIKNQKTAKIHLSIKIQNANSDTSIYKKYIEGEFTYLTPTSNPELTQTLNPEDTLDTSYNQCTIALISMDIMNKIKTSFNGSFREIDMNTLISLCIKDLDAIVVRKPLYNPEFDRIVIPPLNNRTKLMQYLFSQCPFYDTNFMFFVDFNKAYLIDLTGEYCDAQDGQLPSVYVNIVEATNEESYYEGMEEADGSYQIYVNPANTDIAENVGADMVSNQMVMVTDNFEVDFVDLEINNHEEAETKQSFNRGISEASAGVLKNTYESNTVIVQFVKENLNSDTLTPNKEFYINNGEAFKNYDYDGKYTMLYKKELIKNTNGEFGLSVSIALRKVGNITALGAHASASITNRGGRSGGVHIGGASGSAGSSGGSSSGGGGSSSGGGSRGASAKADVEKIVAKKNDKVLIMPTAKRIKATDDSIIRRKPRKISGEG